MKPEDVKPKMWIRLNQDGTRPEQVLDVFENMVKTYSGNTYHATKIVKAGAIDAAAMIEIAAKRLDSVASRRDAVLRLPSGTVRVGGEVLYLGYECPVTRVTPDGDVTIRYPGGSKTFNEDEAYDQLEVV